MEIWPGEDPETYGQKGTLTYTATEVTVTPTHVYNSLSSTWLLIDDLIEAAYWDAEGGPDFDDEFGVYVSDMTLEEYAVIVRESEFPSMTASYSVDGDTLTVTIPLLGSKEYTKE